VSNLIVSIRRCESNKSEPGFPLFSVSDAVSVDAHTSFQAIYSGVQRFIGRSPAAAPIGCETVSMFRYESFLEALEVDVRAILDYQATVAPTQLQAKTPGQPAENLNVVPTGIIGHFQCMAEICHYGDSLEDGRGVPQDIQQAIRCFRWRRTTRPADMASTGHPLMARPRRHTRCCSARMRT
jgi:hypothetical protein